VVTIRLSVPAAAFQERDDHDGEEIIDSSRLMCLSGLEYRHDHARFSDYLGDGGYEDLVSAGVKGGFIRLLFRPEIGQLFLITEFTAPRNLTESELTSLVDYTSGQWSDGIGSNFSQSFATATRINIGCALGDELVEVEQREVV
jgi:hypothetical protein